MSIEPNARRRLQLVYATTRDTQLLNELRQVLEEDQMSFVPSAELLREIALCAACTREEVSGSRASRAGLCEVHRSRWNLEACMAATDGGANESLQRLVQGLLASPDAGAQLLMAFERQRRALRLVMEAHARGAVRLPDSIAASVARACDSSPRFLTPALSRPAVPQAS